MKLDGERIRKRDTDVARPRKWDGYEKGKFVPADKPGPRNAIDQAEAVFPGTAKWFRSPLWDVLKKRKFDQLQIDNALFSLDPRIIALLFEPKPREGESRRRLLPFDAGSARLLQALATFDSLVAIVLMAHLAEIIASPQLRELAVNTYAGMQEKLRGIPGLKEVAADFFHLVDSYCKHWTFLSPSQRMEVTFFSGNEPSEGTQPVKFRLPGL
ncbi:hypothetical protein D3M96_17930 [Alcaligenes aquatilis]|uniref:Uncharacterized protein n=2 Tax=Alcaligenes aquatilis TaxID=323284 RepID=A0A3G2HZ23_9BURK|nr:hypothetical protein D3M96_17930 [Alcaligenes aquatilis]